MSESVHFALCFPAALVKLVLWFCGSVVLYQAGSGCPFRLLTRFHPFPSAFQRVIPHPMIKFTKMFQNVPFICNCSPTSPPPHSSLPSLPVKLYCYVRLPHMPPVLPIAALTPPRSNPVFFLHRRRQLKQTLYSLAQRLIALSPVP